MPTPSNNSQMHNDIMAAGSKEHPPMLAPELVTPEVPVEATIIHMILNGIRDNMYSTVDACLTAQEMCKFTSRDEESIESYYTRFYRMMIEMVRNKLKVDTMQVNVQFLQQLQPEWSRFVTIVKQQNDLDTISFHKLFDILKQHQNGLNEIRIERIARNANHFALFAADSTLSI
ncbi:hypothetical protein Tco_1011668 [Tanacetum coccineum]